MAFVRKESLKVPRMVRTQKERDIRISTPLGPDVLLFHQLDGTDSLGAPFEYQAECLSEDHSIDLDKILGQQITIQLDVGDKTRYFNAIVGAVRQDGVVGDLARYRLSLHPWIWLLSKTADCRVFQKKSVPEIVQAVCKENGFTDFKKSLSGKYSPREYCVQYCESDMDFIHRLLESEGIYYFFEHEKNKHTLVLSDSIGSHAKEPGYETIPFYPLTGDTRERDHIYDWNVSRELKPCKVAMTDFDFEKPKADLSAVSSKKRNHAQSKFEYFEYPGGYIKASDGEAYARKRMEEFQAEFEQSSGAGNALGIRPGILFKLDEYPRSDQNQQYLVTEARYVLSSDSYQAGGGGGEPFTCSFNVIPSKQSFRPPRRTRFPRIFGIQTAVVVGKKSEDVWTDEYGRIKVQFHWDRYGKADENSSCWIRVAQSWAGKGWGGLHIPRIGQEVIVEFINGDPDKPVVTGSVYNGDHKPPYKLPNDASQSGIRTHTTKDGNDKTFNELRFEDKKDNEEIYFHAERDFNRVVENNDTLKVGFEGKDKGDQTIEIHNDQNLTIAEGSRIVEIKKKDDKLKVVKGNQSIDISSGDQSIKIGKGDYSLKMSAGKGTIEAAKSLELKVGGSSIKIEPAKITIKSVQIAIQADGQIQTKAPMIQEQADGSLVLKGGMVQIN